MIKDNGLPLKIIGYEQSTVTQEVRAALTFYGGSENTYYSIEIITPEEFLTLNNRTEYQYSVAFNRDPALRSKIVKLIYDERLSCPTGIHPTVVIASSNIEQRIGIGTLIAPYCSLMVDCQIGDFCLIENYSLISHYVTIGNNVHIHPGTMIAGKSQIGNNCVFNFRSTVLNNISICDNVEIGAVSTVTKDITVPGKYVGTPARLIEKR